MVGLRVTAFVLILAAAFSVEARRSESPPDNAIVAGFQRLDGVEVSSYVGRVWMNSIGAIVPAVVAQWEQYWAYAALRGHTIREVTTFEVAVLDNSSSASVQWVPSAGGVPEGAVRVGVTSDNEYLFSCRVLDLDLSDPNPNVGQKRMMTPGALAGGKCYIEFWGNSLEYSTYEVLVIKD